MTTEPIARAARQQRHAARPEASVWVGASAGTGKTKVLTDRVLRLLLAGTPPSRILCLTFTKAAAAEMAVRINRHLADWAVLGEPDLIDAVTELIGERPDQAAIAAARRLFAEIVDAAGGLNIDTIHAFCQSVLRRFPVEAGVAPHFEVLDERTSWEVLHEAKAQVLMTATDDETLGRALAVLTGLVHEKQFDELIQSLTAERGRLEQLIDRDGGIEGLIARVYDKLDVSPSASEDDVIRAACRDNAFDGGALRATAAAMTEGTATDQKQGTILTSWLADRESRIENWETYLTVYFTRDGSPRARLVGKDVVNNSPQALTALTAEAARLTAVEAARRRHRLAAATAALIRVGTSVLELYAELKAARAAMDYDDLVLQTRALLRDAGSVSWVMYKLDEGIDHILIDEAQDTNPEQWQIVRALADDFFAGKGRAEDEPVRTIFAVGDAKQSIFSFQRADPAGFEESRTYFERQVGQAGEAWDVVDLDVSFRSAAIVLDAVDRVFVQDGARDGVGAPGREIHHQPSRVGHAGRVELWSPPEAPEAPAIEAWAPPIDTHDAPEPEQQVADLVADRIRTWIDNDEPLPARGRAVRAGDFMILVRRRGAFMARVVRALKNRQVAVAGVDRMILTDQLAVMDLIALGEFLLLPGDDLTLATVLRSPLVGITEEQLFELAHNRSGSSLWARLTARRDDDPAFATAHRRLAELLARADYVPPYELFTEVLGAGRCRERLLARLGPEAADPIEEFLSLAAAFERTHPPSLQRFLSWIGGGDIEVKRELEQSGRDQVRVMTVHGAKGLQAPIVILPDTMQVPGERGVRLFWDGDIVLWPPRKADDDATASRLRAEQRVRTMAEYRRLLYVAMTRAEDRLYVCGWPTRRAPPEGNWYDLVRTALTPVGEPIAIDDGGGVRLDNPQTAPAEKEETDITAVVDFTMPEWISEIPAPEVRPPRPLAPSRPEADEPAIASPLADDGAGFRRGLIVHRLLELLPELAPEHRAEACRRWLARQAPDLSAAAREEIAAETLAVIGDKRFAALFGPNSRAEVALTGIVGEQVISGRVDRLAVTDTAVYVVDYKTNRTPARAVAQVAPIYLRQMAAYRALLREIYPGKSMCCNILWTDGPALMALPDAALDRVAP